MTQLVDTDNFRPFARYIHWIFTNGSVDVKELQIFNNNMFGFKEIRHISTARQFQFHLVLWISNDHTYFVVHHFQIELISDKPVLRPKVLSGAEFLSHFGFRTAIGEDLNSENQFVWIIKSAYELRQMLEEYDNLAEIAGAIPIFTR